MKFEVAVIGSGMSGLMASIHLAERGCSTVVVSRGNPICSISSGCIDVAGTDQDTCKAIDQFPKEHPYHKVGKPALLDSIRYFQGLMSEHGLDYHGNGERNRSILTPIGKRRTTSLVPFTMRDAEVADGDAFHIISFKDIKDFFPSYLTSRFPDTDVSVFDAGTYTTVGIATKMDNEDFLVSFIGWIKEQSIRQDRVAIPAVLGITKTAEIHRRLESETGKRFFEIPTLPPSIPGLRLYRTLRKTAEGRGVSFFSSAEILDFREEGKRVLGLTIRKPGRPDYVDAEAFILATGSFVSGGLYSDRNKFSETVFNIPVYSPSGGDLFNEDFFELGHPIEKSGIRVNDQFQPEDSEYENLFAAGSVLAYSETMKYGCGHGMAISTGVAAATHAAECIA